MNNSILSALVGLLAVTALHANDLPTVNIFDDEPEKKKTPQTLDFDINDYAIEDIPNWVSDLSNLPASERQKYMNNFAAAKWAYSKGSLDMCEKCLDECEAIYSKNPNVWNLRASVRVCQERFDEAEVWLKKVRAVAPDDLVANLNYSLMYLGQGNYEASIRESEVLLNELEYKDGMEGLRHTLMFRMFVSLVMLDRVDEARELVKDITPMTFTPLYYYTQTVMAVLENDKARALKEMTAANSIYRTDPYLQTYKQVITFSKLLEKLSSSYTK